ncbi:Hint domain-containing protein [uncultured Litoreibacter sp.]|uniref:Hint domain-containing protein n=1 Tax=uncultured Litoreibacter sp. TaxID=1392394 RepID=UPI00261D9B56|nr:Hint domain-containing protein [uncultured Litoreibacter sp.]
MNNDTQIPQPNYRSGTRPVFRLSEAGLTVGTSVMTPNGQISVEELKGGDRVLTKDHGYQQVRCIAFRDVDLTQNEDQAPIRLRADCIGHERPVSDLFLAPNQRIAMRHPMFDLMFGAREVVARAGDLTHLAGVDQMQGLRGITYVMLGFRRPQMVFTGSLVLDLGASDGPPPRPVLSSEEAKLACSMLAPAPASHLEIGVPLH